MGSNIVDMFNGGTVLITGSTGFLGKLLTEKLLRSCEKTNIAIIVRSKKGLTAEQRTTKMYNENLFDRLRKERPGFMNYINVIVGDLTESPLGLSTVDRDWIVRNVNYIFHCAATIRFDEPIEIATKINIEGTEQLLNMATQMEALNPLTTWLCSTYLEPDPGHLENMNGPTGILAGYIVGFLRVVPNRRDKITDLIPADYTVNALISTMWDTVNRFKMSYPEKPKIFNFVSSVESPLVWQQFMTVVFNSYKAAPPFTRIDWFGIILRVLLHRIPAIVFDFLLILTLNEPKFWKLYDKVGKLIHLLRPFTLNEWKFNNNNTRKSWCSLSREDQQLFPFSMHYFDWNQYINVFYHGIRKHILHEETDNIPMALRKNQILFRLNQVFIFSNAYIVLRILWNRLFMSK
ncbi:fatty acyl-CoA reductase 1-like [Adelges cooleyi]|uniref:fatty acyl-CoA reductase 1-like n=1 Tax=Adelges cooleyi TaxID=133065 RepID=UPI0021802597|nr:fatty acyl-CoA reductase 1-like [Adelges cooleyi]